MDTDRGTDRAEAPQAGGQEVARRRRASGRGRRGPVARAPGGDLPPGRRRTDAEARRRRGNDQRATASSGMWRGRLMVGRLPDGRPDVREVYGSTQKECRRKLDELKQQVAGAALVAPNGLTVAGLLAHWLDDGRVRGLRPKSLAGYEQCARLYLVPAVGRRELAALRPGARPRGPRRPHGARHRPCDGAEGARSASRGPPTRRPHRAGRPQRRRRRPAAAPRPRAGPPPAGAGRGRAPARHTEAAADPLRAFFSLGLYAGCRPGELLALQWADVDWQRGRLHVQRNLHARARARRLDGRTQDRRAAGACSRSRRRRSRRCGHIVLGRPQDRLVLGAGLRRPRPRVLRAHGGAAPPE